MLERKRDEHFDALNQLDSRISRAKKSRKNVWQAVWNKVWDQTWPGAWARIWRAKWVVPPEVFDGFLREYELQSSLAAACAKAKEKGRRHSPCFDSNGRPLLEEQVWMLNRGDGMDLLSLDSPLWYRLVKWEKAQQARVLREMLPSPKAR